MVFVHSILQTPFDSCCPLITKKVKGQPWLSAGIKKLVNERDKLLRKRRKSQMQGLKRSIESEKKHCE